MRRIVALVICTGIVALCPSAATAQGSESDLDALAAQVQALQAQIAALQAATGTATVPSLDYGEGPVFETYSESGSNTSIGDSSLASNTTGDDNTASETPPSTTTTRATTTQPAGPPPSTPTPRDPRTRLVGTTPSP